MTVEPGTTATALPAFDAVVLAGGAASRLGGVDKMLVEVGGIRLIDRALAAVAGADEVVVVGEPRAGTSPVTWTREQPAGGGPVAALAAGLACVAHDVVALLAADLPFVTPTHVDRLRAALGDADGVLYVDEDGRDQPLLSVWRAAALRGVLPAEPAGAGLRRVLAPLTVTRLPGSSGLQDCDTPADVEVARRIARGEVAS